MKTTSEHLRDAFLKDLDTLKKEITAYTDEVVLWKIDKQILNSGGNLCLHLCGNLQHFVGKLLGGTSYERNRDAEFSLKNIPKQNLLDEIEQTKQAIQLAFSKLNEEALHAQYPIEMFGRKLTTIEFLFHLLGHLNYHLGQINYHRRLLA